METYREVSYGWLILIFIIPGIFWITYLYFFQIGNRPMPLWSYLFVVSLFIIVSLVFYRMKVTVLGEQILITFGIGLIWKAIDIIRIESIRVVKNPFYYGWGIRIVPRGTMYNISGTQAIELHFRDSRRIVRIGSKTPQKLKDEIEARIKMLRPRK